MSAGFCLSLGAVLMLFLPPSFRSALTTLGPSLTFVRLHFCMSAVPPTSSFVLGLDLLVVVLRILVVVLRILVGRAARPGGRAGVVNPSTPAVSSTSRLPAAKHRGPSVSLAGMRALPSRWHAAPASLAVAATSYTESHTRWVSAKTVARRVMLERAAARAVSWPRMDGWVLVDGRGCVERLVDGEPRDQPLVTATTTATAALAPRSPDRAEAPARRGMARGSGADQTRLGRGRRREGWAECQRRRGVAGGPFEQPHPRPVGRRHRESVGRDRGSAAAPRATPRGSTTTAADGHRAGAAARFPPLPPPRLCGQQPSRRTRPPPGTPRPVGRPAWSLEGAGRLQRGGETGSPPGRRRRHRGSARGAAADMDGISFCAEMEGSAPRRGGIVIVFSG